MKKLLLVPLTLLTLEICADDPQTYYGNNFYAESTPAYTPPRPGQPTSTTYQSTTPPTPSQSTIQQNYKTPGTTPSYSNSQHPYGPPGAPSTTYQKPSSTTTPQQRRTLPSHPYGPPGSGHALAEAQNNNSQYNNNKSNNSNDNSTFNDNRETPYEKVDDQNESTAAVNRPSASDEMIPELSSGLKSTQTSDRDQYKTASDRALNKKIRDEINGGFDDS
jgi:hypothetical protein